MTAQIDNQAAMFAPQNMINILTYRWFYENFVFKKQSVWALLSAAFDFRMGTGSSGVPISSLNSFPPSYFTLNQEKLSLILCGLENRR
jgi:hypothetical protein